MPPNRLATDTPLFPPAYVSCGLRVLPPEQVRAWLSAPHPQLEGKRAIDLIRNKQTEEVIAILDRLDADAYI